MADIIEAGFYGYLMPYDETLRLMHDLHERVVQKEIANQLMLLEHEPVITITQQHLLRSIISEEHSIKSDGIKIALADRGGDATFHGPGQLVGYPIINISQTENIDIGGYLLRLQKALLRAVVSLGVSDALLLPGFTGIWVKCLTHQKVTLKKLIAIGVGVKNGVTKHGFALNVYIDSEKYTLHLIPCGLKDRGVITLKEYFLQKRLPMPTYSDMVKTVSKSLSEAFSLTLKWRTF